jgi:hypothetical protein
MPRRYRNTLRAHAHALSSLGNALADLGRDHRVAASALERSKLTTLTSDSHFADWIAAACEISMAAERLLELEVELARKFGASWEDVAGVLGVSRQAAWERFGTHARWDRTHRTSRLRQARRAAMFRRMSANQDEDYVAVLRQMLLVGRTRPSPPHATTVPASADVAKSSGGR